MKYHDVIQYSPAYWELRGGIPTASCFDRILTPTGKISAQQDDYIAELIGDRLMQTPPFFTERGRPETREMQHGKETEAEARSWFALHAGLDVCNGGFITTDDGRMGASPDGLIKDADGQFRFGVELKCPFPKTHIKYLMEYKKTGKMPVSHRVQTHGGLVVGEGQLKGWWFISFVPGATEQIAVYHEADEFTVMLKDEVEGFCKKLAESAKEFGPKETEAVQQWRALLTDDCTLASINANLPTLSPLEQTVKAECWAMVKGFADRIGAVFNRERREFEFDLKETP